MDARKDFTVLGVLAGPHPYRAHLHVKAYKAEEAVAEAEGVMNNEEVAGKRSTRASFLAAAVFEGRLQSAHQHAGSVGLVWADDRYGLEHKAAPEFAKRDFTVVCVDPANHQVFVRSLQSHCVGCAERSLDFDFQLIGGVLQVGGVQAVRLHEPWAAAQRSSRELRIRALAEQYNPGYLKYLDTELAIHEPIIKDA